MKIINFFKKYYFFYPFIFAFYPLFSLYLSNYEETIAGGDFLFSFSFTLILLIGATVFSLILTKNKEKLFIIIFLFMTMLLNYGFFFSLASSIFNLPDIVFFSSRLIIFWMFIFIFLFQAVAFSKNSFKNISKTLSFVTFSLIFMAILNLFLKNAFSREVVINPALSEGDKSVQTSSGNGEYVNGNLPDIYYLIIDRYANGKVLKDYYNFDNSEFYTKLKNYGFCIAEDSSANYLRTTHSLASSLNFSYINTLISGVNENSRDWKSLSKLVKRNALAEFLTSKGYEYINMGSWWGVTKTNSLAEKNFDYSIFPELFSVYYTRSLAGPISLTMGLYNHRYNIWVQNTRQLEQLRAISKTARPVYLFAHILAVHEPFVTNENGTFMSMEDFLTWDRDKAYFEQIKYVNNETVKFIDLATADKNRLPIIILQSDEGTHSEDFVLNEEKYNWFEASDESIIKKMKILNAYYLPGKDCGKIVYPKMSPVNSFRMVLNEYFNKNLEYLEDKSFIHKDQSHPYKFREVTNLLDKP